MKIGLGKEKSEGRFKDGATSSVDIDLNPIFFQFSYRRFQEHFRTVISIDL
jgi:hypothetical protein